MYPSNKVKFIKEQGGESYNSPSQLNARAKICLLQDLCWGGPVSNLRILITRPRCSSGEYHLNSDPWRLASDEIYGRINLI